MSEHDDDFENEFANKDVFELAHELVNAPDGELKVMVSVLESGKAMIGFSRVDSSKLDLIALNDLEELVQIYNTIWYSLNHAGLSELFINLNKQQVEDDERRKKMTVEQVQLRIKTDWKNPQMVMPAYQTSGSAGFDLQANLAANERVTIAPGDRVLINTGICLQIPEGYEVQVRPRSGLALKKGVTVLNAPGTIDSDYRDLIGVILHNVGYAPYIVEPGERIAQAVVNKVPVAFFMPWDDQDEIDRGGGFGSTNERRRAIDAADASNFDLES